MAVTTRTSDAFRPRYTRDGQSIGTWFGEELPVGVVALREGFHYDGYKKIQWKTKDGMIHEMEYEPYPESINAVIVAMKLTC